MTDIPRLATERLLFRGFAASDLDVYAEIMADPDVTRYLADGRPLSRDDAWRQMAMFMGHWALRGFGVWAVEERATGALIGRIGCFEPEGWPDFEIAYTLRRSAWGRGLAREGAARALEYARAVLHRDRIVSLIRAGNAGSIRVAESLAARAAETVPFFGAPVVVYRYPSAREAAEA